MADPCFVRSATVAALLVSTLACNGGSSPTAPAVSTTAVSISGTTDMMRVQENVTFSAVASRSDGTTQAVTEWASDAPSVLSINASSGVATGLSAGQATITARNGGTTATRLVRVVPQYQGSWSGRYTVAACTASGDFLTYGWCTSIQGRDLPFSLTLSQTRDTVSGTVTFGEYTGSVSGSMAVGGTLTIAGAAISGGTSLSISSWSTNSLTFGSMTGSFSQRVSSSSSTGSASHTNTILSAARSSTSTAAMRDTSSPREPDTVDSAARRLIGR